jgi:hypothetical protein
MSNDESGGRGRSCFKYGCFGCIALVVLLLVGAGAIVAVGLLWGPPEEQLEQPRLRRELPGPAFTDGPPETAQTGELIPPARFSGRVVLDLNEGSFRIVQAPPGAPIKVDGNYDAGMYELSESLEPGEDGGWVYRVSFDRSVNWIRALFGEGEQDNRIKIAIPAETPFALEGRVGIGESVLELGGLAVLSVDLELGTGSHTMKFDEPTPVPIESLDLAAAIGELRISGLGNASPQRTSIRHRIGDVNIDLRGAWRRDADIGIRCGIGECAVRVPTDVAVEGLSTNIGVGEVVTSGLDRLPAPGEGVPTLRLELSGKIGEVRVSQ